MMKHKKGMFKQLGGLATAVVALVVTFAVGFLIMANVKSQIVTTQAINESVPATYTTAYNATGTLINAAATVPTWVPLIIIAVIGGLLLGLVKMFK